MLLALVLLFTDVVLQYCRTTASGKKNTQIRHQKQTCQKSARYVCGFLMKRHEDHSRSPPPYSTPPPRFASSAAQQPTPLPS